MTSVDDLPGSATAEDALRSAALSRLIIDIATAAAGERELDQILHETLDRLQTTVPLTGGSIALVEGQDLVIRAAVGPFATQVLGQRLRRGPSRSWRVVDAIEPYLTGDLAASGLRIRGGDGVHTIRSWLAVPIVRGGRGIGLVEIDSTEVDAFSPDDASLLSTIVGVLAGPVQLAAIHADERRAAVLREAFIGVISHELRTPITTIYGLSKTLRQHGETIAPDVRAKAIEDIEAEADRLHRLVEDLLILSRSETGRVDIHGEPISIARLLERTVAAEGQRLAGRTFELRLGEADLPIVSGEATYLEQVLRNLISNAAKYSNLEAPIVVAAGRDGDEVIVRVLDEGIGLAAEDAERAFDLFYRAKPASRRAPGAGIGLFVCRQLIEAMGGRIWAQPRDGGGTEVGFALPVRPLEGADAD